jgi:outer membrane lipoprotein-sorting protein
MRKVLMLLLIAMFSVSFVVAQDASLLIDGVNKKFARVRDYQADALIDTKISFLKILPQKAKIYYRKPSQFKVKAEGIAILPKQNFDQLFELLSKPASYSAFVTGFETDKNGELAIVQVLPSSDTSDLVLAKLWIDPEQDLIIKSQLTTRSNGTVLIRYRYGKFAEFALPDQMEFTVELKKFKIPKAVSADINSSSKPANSASDAKTGQIFITLTNYQINKGISGTVFQ